MGTWAQDIAINTLWYNSTAGENPTEAAGGTIVPSAGNTSAVNGAVAVNTGDGKLWVKVTNGGLSGWEEITGIVTPVTVALGGTGVQTLTANGVLIGNGTNAVTAVDLSTAGSLLIGDGSGNPSALAKGSNNTVLTTNGSGAVAWAATAVTINNLTGGTASRGIYATSTTDFNATSYDMTASTIGSATAYPSITTGLLIGKSTVQFTELADYAGDADVRATTVGILRQYTSSRRNKENIVDMTVDSSKIYDLVPKTFKWKNITEDMMIDDVVTSVTTVGKTDFGLIAEDVYPIVPELIGKNADGEPNAVFYSQLSVLLLAELKILKARVAVLEAG